MPRKTNYKLYFDDDYDDGYNAYDDYDGYDDYGSNPLPKVDDKISQRDVALNKPVLWSCSICTYDNDESLVCCEICGVLRDPLVASGKLGESNAPAKTVSNASEENESKKPKSNNGIVAKPLVGQLDETNGNNAVVIKDAPLALASNLDNLKLNSNSMGSRKEKLVDDYKPEKRNLLSQEQGIHDQLNLAVVGHVDSGKSTLCGRLLHLLGRISKKEMHKYEKEAKEKGKGSFAYAWAMDESTDERERGVTMTVAVAYFESKKYKVVLLDSPGHKDFVPNMISGATQADAAILVVDASVGSFEAAVNKMDLVGYKKERFDFIKMQLGTFLRTCGFKESSMNWIPLSAMENQNLVTAASDARLSSWCGELCLLGAIDSLQPPARNFQSHSAYPYVMLPS
ncbi:hypothetical protein HPP92_004268 [Vanilla planifolia]|uniref:Tr-type G domain-containing protein n=1 Tax=Vanilla planifolia TaxID=51239 RepID=A0A835S9U8_VANPL|nr:hypothetical protein HPP92_004268 [Vanilla planifolia]